MKKLFVILAAAFAMVACQTDINEVGVATDGVATVEFEVGAPQMRAYTYSLGQLATNLKYAVYDADGEILSDLTVTDAEINGKANVKIELANNKSYSIIFWAEADNAPYTVDFANKTVAVNYNGAVCNDESRDAFYAYLPFEVKGAATLSVELRRPFAQVNVGTSDLQTAINSGFTPTQSKLVVKNACNVLYLVTGKGDGRVDAIFETANIPAVNETFPVAGNAYMAMSYVLVGKDKASYDVEYTITDGTTSIPNTIGAVPMQANYRTNIYGKLLTSSTDINVEIKPGYDGEHGSEVLAPDYGVKTAEELVALVNNATEDIIIELSNDIAGSITLNKSTNPNVDVTILGNNKTFAGKIHIWGAGGATSTMTIKDVNFVVDGTYTDDEACIYTLGNINGTNSYARNVTIDGCTFSGTGETVAAIRHAVGGTNDWTIKNCTVNAGMHSFLQIANVNSGLVVENCKAYSKNGVNLNQTYGATFTDCQFDVKGYAVRVGVNQSSNPDVAEVFNFTNCHFKSACNDGDAVVIVRGTATNATLTFVNTTLEGTTKISGTVAGTTTIYMDGELYVPGGYYEQNNVIYILSAEGLAHFSGYEFPKHITEIKLMSDIDMQGAEFAGMANVNDLVNLVFNGNGKTISNIKFKTASHFGMTTAAGLFDSVTLRFDGSSFECKDLTLSNVSFADEVNAKWAGAIIGYAQIEAPDQFKLTNVHVKDSDLEGKASIGGMIGMLATPASLYAKNCSVTNTTIVATEKRAAAYVALINSPTNTTPVVFENCVVGSDVTISAPAGTENAYVGDNINNVVVNIL